MHKLWHTSGVDIRHKQRKPADIYVHREWHDAFLKALSVVQNNGIVVLLGRRGNGKTQCGAEIIRRLIGTEAKICGYIRCREIGMALRESYNTNKSITERQAIEQFIKPHLLVIDECQEKPDTEFEQRSLTLLIDRRYAAMKPTVMIANANQTQFKQKMGSSIIDRITEGGGIINFDWDSFRSNI